MKIIVHIRVEPQEGEKIEPRTLGFDMHVNEKGISSISRMEEKGAVVHKGEPIKIHPATVKEF